MPIKIIDGSAATVENINAVLYGVPNAGKSTLALSASRPIIFDFDKGVHRAFNKHGNAVVQVKSWHDIADLTREDLRNFDTVIVDTVGTCLDMLIADICSANPKAGAGGIPNMKGWGILKMRFRTWLSTIKSYSKDVILVAHLKEESKGDETFERIVATGSSKDEVYQSADIMGRMRFENGKRVLSFDPTTNAYAKNVGLPNFVVHEGDRKFTQMADILNQARQNINLKIEQENAESERIVELRERLAALKPSAVVFNRVKDDLSGPEVTAIEKRLLMQRAEELGLSFDREKKIFVDPVDKTSAARAERVEEAESLPEASYPGDEHYDAEDPVHGAPV